MIVYSHYLCYITGFVNQDKITFSIETGTFMQFGSDNQTGASRQVLEMLAVANSDFTPGYGDDHWCAQATEALKDVFGCDLEVFFVATGTAANSLALSCLVQPWETILCHHQAHILQDESTAPEFFSGGARLIPISGKAGRLQLDHLEHYFSLLAGHPPHTPRTGALSIAQVNEIGLVYSLKQVTELCSFAHDHKVHVHMDGARFANAVAALGCSPADLTWKAGVDVLSLGATKCGAMIAEAVLFFNQGLAASFIHRRKQSGHLVSKGRFFGAQFVGWIKNNHWLELASHANGQAQHLAKRLASFSSISLKWPCEANELFVTMPRQLADSLHNSGAEFYQWPPHGLPPEIELDKEDIFTRLVTSFATTDEHIDRFCRLIREYESKHNGE